MKTSNNSYNQKYNKEFFDEEKGIYTYKYPHAAIAADCVVFGFDGKTLKILLIERGLEPFKGMWALPGGFMKVAGKDGETIDISIEHTARRELKEETNLTGVFLRQFKVFSHFDRDPRERVVSVAFISLVGPRKYNEVVKNTIAGDDASNALWWNEEALPPIAFDHQEIIEEAKKYLAEMIQVEPLAFQLLDDTFSMSELQNVYEAITGETFDRRNFQRKAIQSGTIQEISNDYCEEDAEIENNLTTSPRKRKKYFTRREESSNADDGEWNIRKLFNFK